MSGSDSSPVLAEPAGAIAPHHAIGFEHFVQKDSERVAIVDANGECWTRGALFAFANRLSRALSAAGMRPGDALALLSPNCPEFLGIYLAAMQIGLYFVPINWHLTAAEIAYIVRNSGARVIIVHQRQAQAVLRGLEAQGCVPAVRLCIGRAMQFESVQDVICGLSAEPLCDRRIGRPLIYTSATTGLPKAIMRSLDDAEAAFGRLLSLTQVLNSAAGVEPDGGGTHLCQSMLYHVAPLDCSAAALHLGHTVVLMERWTPEEALRLIDLHEIKVSVMVPSMFARLLKLPAEVRARYSVRSLKFVSHGSAPCAVDIKSQMIDWWGPIFFELYGASEGGGTGVTCEEWVRFPGTVGRPHPGAAIKILNEDGEEVTPGTVGTIYIRPYTLDRFEYRGDPEKTLAAYRGDFFTAGDVGYVNEAGYLFICDRKVDMIITGGLNVYSAEVERVLITHRAVADCAVFGVPDDLLGESVVAVVEPLPGVEPDVELTSEILNFLSARLSVEKIPRKIEYSGALPRDPAGKLFKRRLRDPYWAAKPRAI